MYSRGIEQHPSVETSFPLYANRSQMRIVLERFPSALQDCCKVIEYLHTLSTHTSYTQNLFEKSLARKATILYSVCQWELASKAYCELGKLFPNNKDYKQGIQKVSQRIKEGLTGNYNIPELFRKCVKKNNNNNNDNNKHMDVADYCGNIMLTSVPGVGGGRGIKTTKNVSAGEVLMAVKAHTFVQVDVKLGYVMSLNVISKQADSCSAYALRQGVVYKLFYQPDSAVGLYGLYAGPEISLLEKVIYTH